MIFPAPVELLPIDPAAAALCVEAEPLGARALALARGGGFDRLFSLSSRAAPGLRCVGGTLSGTGAARAAFGGMAPSVTGNGKTMAAALRGCFGEAMELLSTIERAGDVSARPSARPAASGWIADVIAAAPVDIDWIAGRDLRDGAEVALPADLCLRRCGPRPLLAPGAASAGVSAGPTATAARRRAILELVERDAAALWWLGGAPAMEIAVEGAELAPLIARLRGDAGERVTHLLDISADLGLPVVVAWSMDRAGRGLALGLACRPRRDAAAAAALLELAQMEMAAAIAAMKRDGKGENSLSAADRRHLARAEVDATMLPALCAAGARAERRDDLADDAIEQFLLARGIAVHEVVLTREDLGIPVTRVVSPDLQPFSDSVTTPRLAAAIARYGGRRADCGVMPF
jgi:thiazole/oxazole-forming peptide maturase SagD family component